MSTGFLCDGTQCSMTSDGEVAQGLHSVSAGRRLPISRHDERRIKQPVPFSQDVEKVADNLHTNVLDRPGLGGLPLSVSKRIQNWTFSAVATLELARDRAVSRLTIF